MRSLRHLLFALLTLLVVAACGTSVTDPNPRMFGLTGRPGTSSPSGGGNNGGGGGSSSAMLTLVNQARQAAGLRSLTHNSKLDAAASLLCQEVAQTGISGHDQTGTAYPEPTDRLAAVGYTWSAWGENLITTGDSLTTPAAFTLWMNSPEHRANILGATFSEYGDAVGSGGTTGICWAQDFGTPR